MSFDIIYCGGPGDVAGTFRRWLAGELDETEVSDTYSGQFFERISARGLRALVIATHERRERLSAGLITVEHRPKGTAGKSGLAWIVADFLHWLRIAALMARQRPRVVVVADLEHWWLLALPALLGVRVVIDLQCALWPRGHRGRAWRQRLRQAVNGWFWRRLPAATICISPECARQVMELAAGRPHGVLLEARSSYRRAFFTGIEPPDWERAPFTLLFAGRMARNKGIFDLLAVLERLRAGVARAIVLEVCGDGSDRAAFAAAVAERGLADAVTVHGQLDRAGMQAALGRAQVVVVPTSAAFAEGMTRVVVEGVLAGRPVVASAVCNAGEVLPRSVCEVAPGDVGGFVAAIAQLAGDRAHYAAMQAACAGESRVFYERDSSWGAALDRALDATGGECCPKPTSM